MSQPNLQVRITNKQILQLALPIAASIVIPQLNFVINNIFLGHLSLSNALGVAGLTGVYYLIFAVLGSGLNGGLQMLIARKSGENKIDEIGVLFAQGIRIALALALIGIAFTLFISPSIFKLVLHDDENIKATIFFLQIRIWGLLFLYLYQMRNALLVGTNQTKLLVYGTAAESVANVIFDYGLIFGKMGLPALGLNGAAYASVIAEAIGLIVIFIVIHAKGINQQFQLFKNVAFNAAITKLILKKSSPLMLQFLLSILVWEFFYVMIEHHGNTASAVSNVMRNVFGFFGCITWAFAATTNTMVSNIIGQGLQDRVEELIYKIMKLSFGFACIVYIVINIFPKVFLNVYGQGDEFIEAAIPVIRVVSTALLLMSIAVVWLNAVTGIGNTKVNLQIELLSIVFYCTYVYLTLEKFNLSITVGWASEWIYWGTMLLPSYFYIKKGKWKTKNSIQ